MSRSRRSRLQYVRMGQNWWSRMQQTLLMWILCAVKMKISRSGINIKHLWTCWQEQRIEVTSRFQMSWNRANRHQTSCKLWKEKSMRILPPMQLRGKATHYNDGVGAISKFSMACHTGLTVSLHTWIQHHLRETVQHCRGDCNPYKK